LPTKIAPFKPKQAKATIALMTLPNALPKNRFPTQTIMFSKKNQKT
jgi:hypothetical protein